EKTTRWGRGTQPPATCCIRFPRGRTASSGRSAVQKCTPRERELTLELIAQAVVGGVLMGFVYALIAAGLSLIFGLMEIVNFAHGEFLMLAMYAAFFAWVLGKLDPLVSLPLVAVVLSVLGWAVYHGIVRWVLDGPMLAQIFATFGLAVLLRSAAQFFFGVDFRAVNEPLLAGRLAIGPVFVGVPQLAASVTALGAF